MPLLLLKSRALYAGYAGLLALATVLMTSACSAPQQPLVTIKTDRGTIAIRVEIARSRQEVSRGLMWRDHLDSDAGMLFIFADSAERTFWMKNTPLPLDIVFIGADLEIVSIAARTTPYSQTRIPSNGAASYVLEVNGGFAAAHGIVPGMSVTLPRDHLRAETTAR